VACLEFKNPEINYSNETRDRNLRKVSQPLRLDLNTGRFGQEYYSPYLEHRNYEKKRNVNGCKKGR
jgi:hypothetical protein